MITLETFRAVTPFIMLSLMIGLWVIGWLVKRLMTENSQHFEDLKKELKHKIDQRSWELEKRMDKLEPHIKNGIIRFRRNQTQLIDQLRYFPKADHDDGPDALEMVFSLITQHNTHGPRVRSLSV